MKLSTKFIATGLLSLFCVATAGAHGTDHPAKAKPVVKKAPVAAMTCSELATAKKNKTAFITPEMQTTEKRCKAESDAKAAAIKKAANDKK